MEAMLRTLIEQNERLISAVEAVGHRIEDLQNQLRADIALADSSSRIESIDDKLGEIVEALEVAGGRSILRELVDEVTEVRSAVELVDSTVQAEAEAFKK